MIFNSLKFFLNGVVNSGEILGGDAQDIDVAGIAQTVSQSGAGSGNGFMIMLIYIVVIGAFFFFMTRQQRKKQKETRELQAKIKAGDNVVTSSGFYGKVASVGGDCFLVEFGSNKSIIIPVNKYDIVAIKTPNLTAGSQEADKK